LIVFIICLDMQKLHRIGNFTHRFPINKEGEEFKSTNLSKSNKPLHGQQQIAPGNGIRNLYTTHTSSYIIILSTTDPYGILLSICNGTYMIICTTTERTIVKLVSVWLYDCRLSSSNRHCLSLSYTLTTRHTHTHKNTTPNKSLTSDALYNIIILHSREIVLCVIIVVVIIINNNKKIRTIARKYVESMRLTLQCIVRFKIKSIKLISNFTTVADYRVSRDYIVLSIVEHYNRFG